MSWERTALMASVERFVDEMLTAFEAYVPKRLRSDAA
jgi:hypothetical protein